MDDLLNRNLEKGNIIAYPVMRRGDMDTKFALVLSVSDDLLRVMVPVKRQENWHMIEISLRRPDRSVRISFGSFFLAEKLEDNPEKKKEMGLLIGEYHRVVKN